MSRTTYTVYALRLKGEVEPRYIGQTYRAPQFRLASLTSQARSCPAPSTFDKWLCGNAGQVEAVAIAEVATRQEALALERELIGNAALLGLRLFNRDHMPRHLKITKDRAA